PLACVGPPSKMSGLTPEGRNSYAPRSRVGVKAAAQDAAGTVTAEAPVPDLSAKLLEALLARFRGSYLQVPPMFSAVKVGGKRLHELAREGAEVHREARPVEVYQLALRDFSASEISVSLTCSKGFFVRSLAHDIGKELACGAHLK